MFTGIIREIAKVERIVKIGNLIKLQIKSDSVLGGAQISDSISVNGVCLTLVEKKRGTLSFEAVASTLRTTNLKRLKKGDVVNLEPALKVGDKLGGHYVLGHVDAEFKLRRVIRSGKSWQLEIEMPSLFKKYILTNGSITIDGVSLTLKKSLTKTFTVDIVPYTFSNTIIKFKKPGDWVNVEFDYLLKSRKL